MLDSGFELETICIKDKFSNGLTSWTYDSFADFCNNIPEDKVISTFVNSNTKSDVFMKLVNCYSFIDEQNASCSFNSTNFIKMMELVNNNKFGLTTSEKDSLAFNIDYLSEGELYRNDEALIEFSHIGTYYSIKEQLQGRFNEPLTFIGYPSESENGTYRIINSGYSIMANSSNIEGAWEFLKYYLFSEDAYAEKGDRQKFSGLDKRLENQLEYEKELHTINDPDSEEEINNDVYYTGGENGYLINIEPFSDEEAELYDKFVKNSVKNTFRSNKDIEKIIKEELDYYFEGERPAEETADIIQNRVSIYISEHY